MKRIGAILCLSIMLVMLSAATVFGQTLDIEKSSPKDGSTGQSVDNMGVKVYFNEDVHSKENKKANANRCKLIDDKGKEVPSIVVFDDKNKKVMMVLADTNNKKTKIKGKTKYSLVIEKGFEATSGNVLEKEEKVTFTTLDPKSSMTVSMVMMGLMVVGMVFFTSKEAKKQAQEAAKKKDTKVNPYKVAKETGKSVQEIVEKENKRKEKEAEKAAKKKKLQEENKVEISTENKRVSRPRPISEAGSTMKAPKKKKPEKKVQPQHNKSQNPNKNKGKRKK